MKLHLSIFSLLRYSPVLQSFLICSLLAQALCSIGFSQMYRNDPEKPWNKYLAAETLRLSEATNQELREVTSENWPETQSKWRSQLQDMLGLAPWPERGPLQVRVTRQVELDSIIVQNLVFEPSPGLYATANLYLPQGQPPEGGWPAVVYVCGHARADESGRLMGNKTGYQHHGIWFANHGFACIIVDTVQLGEFQGEHHGTYSQGRWDWVTKGYTPAGVEAWIAIRSLELLLERTDINPKAIGITGRSGGGAYSWFAAALDDRFQAAVPVAGITDLQDHVIDGCIEGHCDCMFMVNKYQWDFGKLAALIAPRPLLLANTDSDTIFPLSGVMRIHNQLDALYDKLGAADAYGVLIAPGPHQDVQELQVGAFKWLAKHLTGKELVVESAAKKELAPKDMVAFARELPKHENVTNLSKWFVKQHSASQAERAADWEAEGHNWIDKLMALNASSPPIDPQDNRSAHQQIQHGQSENLHWKLWQAVDVNGWGSGWIEVQHRAETSSAETSSAEASSAEASPAESKVDRISVHLGAWRDLKGTTADLLNDPAILNTWLSRGELANKLHNASDTSHYILLPRGWDLSDELTSLGELTHLHRRFYLLGDSLEQMQLRDDWRSLQAISQQNRQTGGAQPLAVDLVGYHRFGIAAGLIAWNSLRHSPALFKIASLRLENGSEDPRLYACLPAFEQRWDAPTLFKALHSQFDFSRGGSTRDANSLLAIDTSRAPQLASGVQVSLHGDGKGTLTSRSTRWSLANLGDLAEPTYKASTSETDSNLSEDGIAGVSYAVPGVPAELRFRWRKTGAKDWQATPWRRTEADFDYIISEPIDELEPGARYEYVAETRPIDGSSPSASASGSFSTWSHGAPEGPQRIGLASDLRFEAKDGTFGFDSLRTMLRRDVRGIYIAKESPRSGETTISNPMDLVDKQRISGMKSVIEFRRRIPQIDLRETADAPENAPPSGFQLLPLRDDILICFVEPTADWEMLAQSVATAKRPSQIFVATSLDSVEPLEKVLQSSSESGASVTLVVMNRPESKLAPAISESGTSKSESWNRIDAGPISVAGLRLQTPEGLPQNATDQQAPSQCGYVELEIPTNQNQGKGMIRGIDPQGAMLFELAL